MQIAPVQQERKRKGVETKPFNQKCTIWLKKSVSWAALWAQVKLMKRRFPQYTCDSLGDSNQAEVHFLGIGSQLRGAALPLVIKHSQAVTTAPLPLLPIPLSRKKSLVQLKGGEPCGFCPFCTIFGVHGMSGNLCANLGDRANQPTDASCSVWWQYSLQIWGFHQNKQFATLRNP